MKKILLSVFLFLVFFVVLMEAPIIALLMIIGTFFYYKKKKANKNLDNNNLDNEFNNDNLDSKLTIENPDNESPSKNSNHIYFNVAGISKTNDQNQNIQKLIKGFVKEHIEMVGYRYEDMTKKEILESYENVYEADIYGDHEIKFEPEPDNPYDPNAIKVIHEDIGHIGYVPKDINKKVLDIISSDYNIEWKLIGGKYKYADIDDDGNEKVITKTLNYGITIDLYY